MSSTIIHRETLDDLYDWFAEKYLNTSMLYVPHYYRNKLCKASDTCNVDLEAIAFAAALYDYQMRVPLIKRSFITFVDTLSEMNMKLLELSDPTNAGEVMKHVVNKLGRAFHRFDPFGEFLPILINLALRIDLERKAVRGKEHDKYLLRGLWNEIERNRNFYESFLRTKNIDQLKQFLGCPCSDSPLKRINLFLRWVVRDEYPDLGLWSRIDKSELKFLLVVK